MSPLALLAGVTLVAVVAVVFRPSAAPLIVAVALLLAEVPPVVALAAAGALWGGWTLRQWLRTR